MKRHASMNRVYRLVWSHVHKIWIPVAETSRGRTKGSSRKLFAAALSLTAAVAQAEPIGGQVVSGSGSIEQSGTTTTINQASQNLSVNWQSFNIAPQETVNFQQPSTSAIAVNRIADTNGTQILGHLNANGQVYLINPNGILFGQGAQVNVGGLVASTLDMSDSALNSNERTFSGSGTGSVINKGTITAANGGSVALLGNTVSNQGTITAQLGTVALGAGSAATLTFNGNNLVKMQIDQSVLNSLAENSQLIQAEGGQVIMSAGARSALLASVVNNTGVIEARTVENHGGVIILGGDMVVNTGSLNASGNSGGTVEISGRSLLQGGAIHADGNSGNGGEIKLNAGGALIQTDAGEITANGGGTGGNIALTGGSSAFLSGKVSANGDSGGHVTATAPQLTLAAAKLSADGRNQGGAVLVGGDAHGANPDIANADHTSVNSFTTLSAQGRQGKVVVWADDVTDFFGSAKTGPEGFIEVSGKQTLNYGGQANAGMNGNVLFDPTNLNITASAPSLFYLDLANPNPAANEKHGNGGVMSLSSGNIVVASQNDSFGGTDAGAVYLYNGSTGALISTLVGSASGDLVGNGGITALSNGNYVVRSYHWSNGAIMNVGAATWGNGLIGTTGVVSSANSLVGTTANDQVGHGITSLSNGNYVVSSTYWSNGAATDAGAVTWGNGLTGTTGAVSSANSLVGSTANDLVSLDGITALNNGNYVVHSSSWDNGAVTNAGAVTWGNGAGGTTGAISSANSLVGTTANDQVGDGFRPIIALSNGNYVVSSSRWDNGAVTDAGAVTWGNGLTGTTGAVSSANSLVGTTAGDPVGFAGITALSNGNYVVSSSRWDNGAVTDAGAATWGNGLTGTTGAVSSANSLVGTTAGDQVGLGITALSNGNYVVSSSSWDNGAATDAGAVTWGNGAGGTTGAVSSANSLVGSTAQDRVGLGGITALSNGNYVVSSYNWDNGATTEAGAVTWGNGAGGTTGAVSSANSLVGSTAQDQVGYWGITALSNGNYVVSSYNWDNGAATDAGAVTWGNGAGGTTGAVSSANSLVGTTANDQVGDIGGITELSNGNYMVSSSNWDNGAVIDAGAVTWGNGAGGTTGAVSSANSLVGTTASDQVGLGGITALSNGNYVVNSYNWDNGAVIDAGAVTWGNGAGGTTGAVSSANSLVGTTAGDQVGNDVNTPMYHGNTALSNGNYVVSSYNWSNGAIMNAGAVTWGNGLTGTTGVVSSANSLVGSSANDRVGYGGITALSNGNYLVRSILWDNGAAFNAGAVWLVADPSNLATMVNNSIGNTSLSPTAIAGAAVTGSTVTLQASNNISVNSAINVAGRLNLVAGNAMTLNAGITSTATGDALQLSGLSFTNNAGANALSTPNGRWLVWSANPANNTLGGLTANFTQYSATYDTTTPSGSSSSFLYSMPVVTSLSTSTSTSTSTSPAPAPEPTHEPNKPPESVTNVTALLTANLTSTTTNSQPAILYKSSFLNKETQGSGQNFEESSSSPKSNSGLTQNNTITIGGSDMIINIVDDGVKLPDNN
ncbi:filamentous hemagglutinin N-terminal domain-containing protein [Methylobacter sp.]|uniref:two-partner secretion domain-containing protein n=1 Tax=Methylobacter sp. TaxID=2051955 RepID=UPI0012113023|nr:filamentous hemagglutinin N-terminal domain-containing protein [Methylobacter sp.]TAK62426.1 MAG: filamentous hemagglutinin N-terminal domain-containing protein [Methylobacter sp.]